MYTPTGDQKDTTGIWENNTIAYEISRMFAMYLR